MKLQDDYFKTLKRRREENMLTVRAVADFAEISPTYVSRLENGFSKPSLEVAIKLSKVLNFDISEIIEIEEGDKLEGSIVDLEYTLKNNTVKYRNKIFSKEEIDRIISFLNKFL